MTLSGRNLNSIRIRPQFLLPSILDFLSYLPRLSFLLAFPLTSLFLSLFPRC